MKGPFKRGGYLGVRDIRNTSIYYFAPNTKREREVMASSTRMMILVVVLALALITSTEAAISCGTVTSNLIKCVPYLTGKASSLPAICCNGVKTLYGATKNSRADRITACNCVVRTAKTIPNINAASVSSLPGKCGVNLGYSPSPTTNCNGYVPW